MRSRNSGRTPLKKSCRDQRWLSGTVFEAIELMQKSGKIVVASQHYPPDQSTTAAIMSAIANHLAKVDPTEIDVRGDQERRRENRYSETATAAPPMPTNPTPIAADCILVDAIASAASARLRTNTSLTTRHTAKPLSVAR